MTWGGRVLWEGVQLSKSCSLCLLLNRPSGMLAWGFKSHAFMRGVSTRWEQMVVKWPRQRLCRGTALQKCSAVSRREWLYLQINTFVLTCICSSFIQTNVLQPVIGHVCLSETLLGYTEMWVGKPNLVKSIEYSCHLSRVKSEGAVFKAYSNMSERSGHRKRHVNAFYKHKARYLSQVGRSAESPDSKTFLSNSSKRRNNWQM